MYSKKDSHVSRALNCVCEVLEIIRWETVRKLDQAGLEAQPARKL